MLSQTAQQIDQSLPLLALAAIALGLIQMHVRLRNRSSLFALISFSTLAVWIFVNNWFREIYTDSLIASSTESERNAQALVSWGWTAFDSVSSIASAVVILVFLVSFFLAAKSIKTA